MDCDIYEDLQNTDLGATVTKLEENNAELVELVQTLQGDIEKLCKVLTLMKSKERTLTNNISELFNTAKTEVARKNKIIADLQRKIDDLIFKRHNKPHQNKVTRTDIHTVDDEGRLNQSLHNQFNDNIAQSSQASTREVASHKSCQSPFRQTSRSPNREFAYGSCQSPSRQDARSCSGEIAHSSSQSPCRQTSQSPNREPRHKLPSRHCQSSNRQLNHRSGQLASRQKPRSPNREFAHKSRQSPSRHKPWSPNRDLKHRSSQSPFRQNARSHSREHLHRSSQSPSRQKPWSPNRDLTHRSSQSPFRQTGRSHSRERLHRSTQSPSRQNSQSPNREPAHRSYQLTSRRKPQSPSREFAHRSCQSPTHRSPNRELKHRSCQSPSRQNVRSPTRKFSHRSCQSPSRHNPRSPNREFVRHKLPKSPPYRDSQSPDRESSRHRRYRHSHRDVSVQVRSHKNKYSSFNELHKTVRRRSPKRYFEDLQSSFRSKPQSQRHMHMLYKDQDDFLEYKLIEEPMFETDFKLCKSPYRLPQSKSLPKDENTDFENINEKLKVVAHNGMSTFSDLKLSSKVVTASSTDHASEEPRIETNPTLLKLPDQILPIEHSRSKSKDRIVISENITKKLKVRTRNDRESILEVANLNITSSKDHMSEEPRTETDSALNKLPDQILPSKRSRSKSEDQIILSENIAKKLKLETDQAISCLLNDLSDNEVPLCVMKLETNQNNCPESLTSEVKSSNLQATHLVPQLVNKKLESSEIPKHQVEQRVYNDQSGDENFTSKDTKLASYRIPKLEIMKENGTTQKNVVLEHTKFLNPNLEIIEKIDVDVKCGERIIPKVTELAPSEIAKHEINEERGESKKCATNISSSNKSNSEANDNTSPVPKEIVCSTSATPLETPKEKTKKNIYDSSKLNENCSSQHKLNNEANLEVDNKLVASDAVNGKGQKLLKIPKMETPSEVQQKPKFKFETANSQNVKIKKKTSVNKNNLIKVKLGSNHKTTSPNKKIVQPKTEVETASKLYEWNMFEENELNEPIVSKTTQKLNGKISSKNKNIKTKVVNGNIKKESTDKTKSVKEDGIVEERNFKNAIVATNNLTSTTSITKLSKSLKDDHNYCNIKESVDKTKLEKAVNKKKIVEVADVKSTVKKDLSESSTKLPEPEKDRNLCKLIENVSSDSQKTELTIPTLINGEVENKSFNNNEASNLNVSQKSEVGNLSTSSVGSEGNESFGSLNISSRSNTGSRRRQRCVMTLGD